MRANKVIDRKHFSNFAVVSLYFVNCGSQLFITILQEPEAKKRKVDKKDSKDDKSDDKDKVNHLI